LTSLRLAPLGVNHAELRFNVLPIVERHVDENEHSRNAAGRLGRKLIQARLHIFGPFLDNTFLLLFWNINLELDVAVGSSVVSSNALLLSWVVVTGILQTRRATREGLSRERGQDWDYNYLVLFSAFADEQSQGKRLHCLPGMGSCLIYFSCERGTS